MDSSNSWDVIAIADLSLDPNLQRHTGFVPEILWRLATNLNFKIQLAFPADGQWGSKMDNGSWTGMVGDLFQKRADVSSGGISIITERALDIDFTQPILLDKITLTSQIRKQPSLNYWSYVQVFTPVGWGATMALLSVLGLSYLFIQYCQREPLQHEKDRETFGFLNSIGLVGTLQLQLAYPLLYESRSVKVLFLATSMTCYFLYASYTAVMTSEMTFIAPPAKLQSLAVSRHCTTMHAIAQKVAPFIGSFQNLLDSDYKLIVLKGAIAYDIFSTSKPGSMYHTVYKALIESNPNSLIEQDTEVKEMLLRDPDYITFGSPLGYKEPSLIVSDVTETVNSPIGKK